MNVFVPWVGTWPKDVLQAIDEGKFVGPVTDMELDADDPEDYWCLLANLWRGPRRWMTTNGPPLPFIIVEHDIIVAEYTLEKMANCLNPWCATSYRYLDQGLYYGLGCMKFGTEVMERVPDALEQVAVMRSPGHPQKHWCSLDGRLQIVLRGGGFNVCQHGEVLEHRGHDGHSRHGCR